jgi:ATP-dependent exoDNAse (exonuclease V) beta subunit
VWWDPGALDLDKQEEVGLRQQRILEADTEGVAANEGIRAHERWQTQRAALLEGGATAWISVQSVSERVDALQPVDPADEQDRVTIEEVSVDRSSRPGGRRFGSLVHATLAVVDLDAKPERIDVVAAAEGRLLGCPPQEVEAAAGVVRAAIDHPLLRRAAAADQLRRETPLLLKLPDGSLLEGVVDLAFREANHWTVVDFKTDRELGDRRSRYAAQVGLYADAISQATGEPTRGVLLAL